MSSSDREPEDRSLDDREVLPSEVPDATPEHYGDAQSAAIVPQASVAADDVNRQTAASSRSIPAASSEPQVSLVPPVVTAHQPVAKPLLSEPSFLHPSSIFFDAASHLRRYLFPAVIALYSAASGGAWGLGFAAILFGFSLLGTLFRYFTLRYRVQGSDFIVTEGLIFRRVRSVPIRRIQNVDLVQNVLHRIFGVAEVRIETASGTEPEAVLRVLTHAQIEELRRALFVDEHESVSDMGEVPNTVDVVSHEDETTFDEATAGKTNQLSLPKHTNHLTEPASNSGSSSSRLSSSHGVLIHQIPIKLLMAAGLSSNRGMVLLGILFGLYFQGFGRSPVDGNWNGSGRDATKSWVKSWFQAAWNWFSDEAEQVASGNNYVNWGLAILLGLVVVLLVLRIVGIAWYLLRFYDHRLERYGSDLRVSCGLLTRVSATIPRKRIQFISVHRSLMMRWMKLASIRIETAGGSATEKEDAASTVSKRWFLPVVREADVPRLIKELRPGIEWQESSFPFVGVAPGTAPRLMRGVVLVSLLISGVGWFNWSPWGAFAGVIVFPIVAYLARKKSRSMAFARTPWGVVYRSGLFTRKISMAFYDRIQAVELTQSPFDRRWKMATLQVDTAAAGPADHTIAAQYLDADFANAQFRELLTVAAANKPVWA